MIYQDCDLSEWECSAVERWELGRNGRTYRPQSFRIGVNKVEITNGKQTQPIKCVVYGPEGIGKSTFASLWPKPLFIDTEDSTSRMDVSRGPKPTSWSHLGSLVKELTSDCLGFRTLVIDTADWADKLCCQHVCDMNGKTSIEGIGYGKGWVMVSEEWKKALDAINLLIERQAMHVVFLAHAQMRKFEQPDEAGTYDRWEMKMEKKSSSLLKEWADLVLFANYKTMVVEIDGKKKAQGGERVMYTAHHPCWDAKNRFGLSEELKFSIDPLKGIIAACTKADPTNPSKQNSSSAGESAAQAQAEPAGQSVDRQADPDALPGLEDPKQETTQEAKAEPKQDLQIDPEKVRLLDQLRDLMKSSGITTEELGAEMARKGVCPAGMLPPSYNVDLLKRITTNWDKIVDNITNIIRKGA